MAATKKAQTKSATTKSKTTPREIKDKEYRLLDDRSGLSTIMKTGKNGKILIFDKTLNISRPIRHCPSERSIFIDEQSEHAYVEPIIFLGGNLLVPKESQMTQQFLDASPDN